jgi:hypothetical protein
MTRQGDQAPQEGPHPFEEALRPLVRMPGAWIGCALDFTYTLPLLFGEREKAEAVWASGEILDGRSVLAHVRAYTLLAGYAAENFVKGLWVAHALKTGRSLDDGSKTPPLLPRRLDHHDLLNLSEEAELPLSSKDQEVLGRLQRAIVWWAKYPVPKKARDFDLFGTGSGEAAEIRELLRHLERLARAYHANPETAWPPDPSTAKAEW